MQIRKILCSRSFAFDSAHEKFDFELGLTVRYAISAVLLFRIIAYAVQFTVSSFCSSGYMYINLFHKWRLLHGNKQWRALDVNIGVGCTYAP